LQQLGRLARYAGPLMRKTCEHWLGHEFVALSAESPGGLGPGEGLRALLERFGAELPAVGLSLEDTIRTRLWARDREGRDEASRVRVEILSGKRRSASSSFICPERFDSDATVALDLLAVRPSGSAKTLREYEPPIAPLRYLIWDDLVVLSGVTSEREGLSAQLEQILPAIGGSLAAAGVEWPQVVNIDSFVHRSVSSDPVDTALRSVLGAARPRLSYTVVDGYSHPAKLCEIEVTAINQSRTEPRTA
jgi:enamine deaminase RidA (YjgF/YER057c/UK114 family)